MTLLRRLVPILAIAYWIVLFVATHVPAERVPRTRVGDKTAHVVGYALLAGVLCVSLWLCRPKNRWLPVIVLVAVLAYAAFDELTQPLIGRVADPIDWVADAAGAICAVLLFALVRAKLAPLDRTAQDQAEIGNASNDR